MNKNPDELITCYAVNWGPCCFILCLIFNRKKGLISSRSSVFILDIDLLTESMCYNFRINKNQMLMFVIIWHYPGDARYTCKILMKGVESLLSQIGKSFAFLSNFLLKTQSKSWKGIQFAPKQHHSARRQTLKSYQ